MRPLASAACRYSEKDAEHFILILQWLLEQEHAAEHAEAFGGRDLPAGDVGGEGDAGQAQGRKVALGQGYRGMTGLRASEETE